MKGSQAMSAADLLRPDPDPTSSSEVEASPAAATAAGSGETTPLLTGPSEASDEKQGITLIQTINSARDT